MTKDEALRIALDAFGEIAWSNETRWQSNRAKVAITAIEAAREQPQEKYTYGTPLLDAMVGCPPCNNHCNQGRTCPSRETRETATPSLDKEFDTAYAEYKANFFDIGLYAGKHIGKEIQHQIDPPNPTRNEVLEEVAKQFDKMPFGDTAASFARYVRDMKT